MGEQSAAMADEEPQRRSGARRSSSMLQTVALEAIAPRALSQDDDAHLSPRASLLADMAFTDGTLSLQRLSRRLSVAMGRTSAEETAIGISDSAQQASPPSRRGSLPPPPPPPLELTDEVKAAVDAAAQRRASVTDAKA